MYTMTAWSAAALAALGPPLQALATYSFLLLRLFLYVICVSIAWVAILEQPVPEPQAVATHRRARPTHARTRLTAASLAEHNAAESLETDSLGSSELDDDEASISGESEAIAPAVARTQVPARHAVAPPLAAPVTRPGSVEVERSAVPAHTAPATPPQQKLKEAVASAAQGAQEGAATAETGGKRAGRRHKKKHKPLLNRLVERYLW